MTPRNPRAAQNLAVAIDQYHEWKLELETVPAVGEAWRNQVRNYEKAEKDLRAAFREVTGMTLVRGRGGHGWHVRD